MLRAAITSAVLAAGLWLTIAPAAIEASPEEIAQIDQQFVCPEALASDQARQQALHDFFTTFAHAEPNSTVPDLLLYRRALLAKHGCRKTLASLDAADAAVASGKDVQIQAWLPVVKAQVGVLSISTDHLALVVDPRFENEKVVGAYLKLDFAAPRTTNATHVRYDTVVSHELFYCGTARHALVETFYFLGGAEVLSEPEPFTTLGQTRVYDVVPTDAKSFNAPAQKWVCGTANGQAA